MEEKGNCQRQPADRLVAVFVGKPANAEGIIADNQLRMWLKNSLGYVCIDRVSMFACFPNSTAAKLSANVQLNFVSASASTSAATERE